MIYLELFLSFLQVGMFSIGGGYAAMPLIQAQVAERHAWLTMQEFTDLITIAEMTPGPITINSATFAGIRIAGVGGAAAATLGCIFPALIIVPVLAFVYYRYRSMSLLQGILGALRPVVVAMIASAGFSILLQVVFGGQTVRADNLQWTGIGLSAAAFFALRKFRWNPILIMCLCGAGGLIAGLVSG